MTTIEKVHDAARQQLGASTRVELGRLDVRDVARFDVALRGSLVASGRVMGEEPSLTGVHPLFLSAVLAWGAGPEESELLADGNAVDPFGGVDLGGLRLMGGGQQLTVHRPVNTEDELVMETSIDDVTIRKGRQGDILMLVVLRRYLDANGDLVSECRETFLGREEV